MRILYKNGYGVSIINNDFSYGLEMAVLRWTGTWDDENDCPKEIKTSLVVVIILTAPPFGLRNNCSPAVSLKGLSNLEPGKNYSL